MTYRRLAVAPDAVALQQLLDPPSILARLLGRAGEFVAPLEADRCWHGDISEVIDDPNVRVMREDATGRALVVDPPRHRASLLVGGREVPPLPARTIVPLDTTDDMIDPRTVVVPSPGSATIVASNGFGSCSIAGRVGALGRGGFVPEPGDPVPGTVTEIIGEVSVSGGMFDGPELTIGVQLDPAWCAPDRRSEDELLVQRQLFFAWGTDAAAQLGLIGSIVQVMEFCAITGEEFSSRMIDAANDRSLGFVSGIITEIRTVPDDGQWMALSRDRFVAWAAGLLGEQIAGRWVRTALAHPPVTVVDELPETLRAWYESVSSGGTTWTVVGTAEVGGPEHEGVWCLIDPATCGIEAGMRCWVYPSLSGFELSLHPPEGLELDAPAAAAVAARERLDEAEERGPGDCFHRGEHVLEQLYGDVWRAALEDRKNE
jgi:hypothetical protein